MTKLKMPSNIHYNSPVILTLTLLSFATLVLGFLTNDFTTGLLFSVYRSSLADPFSYIRAFGHIVGHSDFAHFSGNILLLLVVGPPMEEKYGSRTLLIAILLTALISGMLHCLLFPNVSLLGASGIVFMLIMLSSLSGMKSGSLPLTMILVGLLYLGQEVFSALFVRDNVANFIHIVGGLAGTVFGFWAAGRNVAK